ncbi:hypothetical protein GA830_05755 [Mesorhizobium sp. NBSH29]|uniref:hypothetical protein n=1 Tax=Mesorhizobium sp. NBSH29 TaxID=2654249 RepID=UPI0018966856|nr:hypothetical protein [Mesorhizobium sp. NBSH29]QPC86297.1 hypothetical protein GA830_05755 [Mesorhizobium sp. NBSH29]
MNIFPIAKIAHAAAVGVIIAVSMSAWTTPSLAYACKALPVQAEALSITQTSARAQALKNWSAKTKDKFHLAWSVWDISKDKSLTCRKGAGNWSCKAKAKPCLYVVP